MEKRGIPNNRIACPPIRRYRTSAAFKFPISSSISFRFASYLAQQFLLPFIHLGMSAKLLRGKFRNGRARRQRCNSLFGGPHSQFGLVVVGHFHGPLLTTECSERTSKSNR